MPDTLLNVLKFFLIALIWLFFIRAMRAIWVEVKHSPSVPDNTAQVHATSAAPAWQGAPPLEEPRFAPSVTGRKVPVLQVEVMSPPEHAGTIYELTDEESVIGRAAGCAIPVEDDTFVSHLHARIFTRGTEFWFEDLGSTNGSFVNSRKITSPVPLRNGDTIQVGRTILHVEK